MQHVYCGRLLFLQQHRPFGSHWSSTNDHTALPWNAWLTLSQVCVEAPGGGIWAHSLGVCLKYGKPTASSTWHAVMCSLSGIPLKCPQYSSNRADLCTHWVS